MKGHAADALLEEIQVLGHRLRRLNLIIGDIRRYEYPERALHWVHMVSFILLMYTGLVVYFPFLVPPPFGYPFMTLVHRLTGVVFLVSGATFMLLFPRRTLAFMSNFMKWRLRDLVWMLKFPLYLLMPWRFKLPYVEDELNPGQKVVGGLLIMFSFLTCVTGPVRWPIPWLPATLVYRAEAAHQLVVPLFLLVFLGHFFIGIGVHPEFRGVWRSMLGDGLISSSLARRHWPGWFREKRYSIIEHPGTPRRPIWKGIMFLGLLVSFPPLVLLLIPGPPLTDMTELGRVDRFPQGVFVTRVADVSYTVRADALADLPGRETRVGREIRITMGARGVAERDLRAWEVKWALIRAASGIDRSAVPGTERLAAPGRGRLTARGTERLAAPGTERLVTPGMRQVTEGGASQ